MATVKFYLDRRAVKFGNPAHLKIQIIHNRKVAYIATHILLNPEQWDNQKSTIINHPQARMLNQVLKHQQAIADLAIIETIGASKRKDLSVQYVKRIISEALTGVEIPQDETATTFVDKFKSFMASRKTPGNRLTYERTFKHLCKFDKDIEMLSFDDITKRWLERFDDYLAQTSPSLNSRAIHFRNIRAVFNDAIADELTTHYPFRQFKIKTQPTRKRALTVEQLRQLATYPVEEYQEKYRDMFMLMFLLRGVNAVDLLNAKPDALVNGRFEYIRAKTHVLYSVKVEPEAMHLINKYKGRDYLLNIMDSRGSYLDFLRRMDNALKRIGPVERIGRGGKKVYHPLFPDLSQYWCRHTWATLGYELDIPIDTIAAGLGHGGNTVTDIYIKPNQKKVDNANRKIIDYFLAAQ